MAVESRDGLAVDLPSLEEFDRELGAPLLTFSLEQANIEIPTGAPHCCRQVHQEHCLSHVAKTLVGCEFDVRLPTGEVDTRRPIKRVFDGDVMARPAEFSSVVLSVAVLAKATAAGMGGVLTRLIYHIWTLNLEQAAIWTYLADEQDRQHQARLEEAEPNSGAWIEALPVTTLDPYDLTAAATAMGKPGFHRVEAYARKVIVLPNEIGHDGTTRYITSPLGGTAGDVPPAVEALLRDPTEDDDG